MPAPPLNPEIKKEIQRLRAKGMTCLEVAKKLKVSAGVVSNITRGISAELRGKKRQQVIEAIQDGWSFGKIKRCYGVSPETIKRITESMRAEEEPSPSPYESLGDDEPPKALSRQPYTSFDISSPGHYGVIGDIHIPSQDDTTLKLFVAECKRRNVKGVILNGDILDCHEVSTHDRDRDLLQYRDEIEEGKEFLAWLRRQLPYAEIVYKMGNHEERVYRYLIGRAPAIEGLEGVNLESWLHFKNHGIISVTDRRIINLGKLHVIHGHEYRGGGGVNPARWLYLRARSVALTNHFHRTSEHHERGINMKYEAAWSVGCACDLFPRWMVLNNWNHGFAFVEVSRNGDFSVENKRVLEGKVV